MKPSPYTANSSPIASIDRPFNSPRAAGAQNKYSSKPQNTQFFAKKQYSFESYSSDDSNNIPITIPSKNENKYSYDASLNTSDSPSNSYGKKKFSRLLKLISSCSSDEETSSIHGHQYLEDEKHIIEDEQYEVESNRKSEHDHSSEGENEAENNTPVYDEFDPYVFMKLLPAYDEVKSIGKFCLPPSDNCHSQICLVLDLDETLVHCAIKELNNPDIVIPVEFNGITYQVNVKKRPYLDHFLDIVSQMFEVVIFTASQQVYANKLLDALDPHKKRISHRLFREACLQVEGNFLKDLNVLGRDLRKCVLVDNSPHAFGYQIDNGIPIESWFDNDNDDELLKLIDFLSSLTMVEDVRPILRNRFKTFELVENARIDLYL